MSKHFEMVTQEHSSGTDYQLFMEARYYLVWIRVSECNVKVRVEAKTDCSHYWFTNVNTTNQLKWSAKYHPAEYAAEKKIDTRYYVIEVSKGDAPSLMSEIVRAILDEWGNLNIYERGN
jgi:hypothetical protein